MSAAERRDSGILADSSESYSSAPSAGSLCPTSTILPASLPASLPSSLLASLPSSLPASRQATQSRSRKRKAQADTVVSYSGTSSSQVVTPHLQSEEQIQRLNVLRVKEFEAQVNTEEQRRHQLADSTKKTYIRYQQHWEAWCTRKGYGSDFSVRANKFLMYMKENLEEKPFIPDNDINHRDAVLPLRVNAKLKGSVTSFELMKYLEVEPVSFETADAYIKAVIDLYNSQRNRPDMMHEQHPRTHSIITLMEGYKRRLGQTKTAKKMRTFCVDQGEEIYHLKEVMRQGWRHNYSSLGKSNNHKVKGLRDRGIAAWSFFMMTRGENMRKATLADIQAINFGRKETNNGQFVLGIVLTMLQGKVNRDGKECMTAIIRNKNVEVCPIGALGFYLFELWQCSDVTVPNFADEEDWYNRYLWVSTSDPSQKTELSQAAHYMGQSHLFDGANIPVNKPTHYHRGAGARFVHQNGCEIQDIEKHAHWSMNRLMTHYLDLAISTVAFKMSGFTSVNERPWYVRNVLLPPNELQIKIFPFIESYFDGHPDWKKRIQNIMEDREICYGRPEHTRLSVSHMDVPAINILSLLAHLRKVILQDAVVLMDISSENHLSNYSLHGIFRHKVFQDPQFHSYRLALKDAMANATSPYLDSLNANSPAIVNELRGVSTKLSHDLQHVQASIDNLTQRADEISSNTRTLKGDFIDERHRQSEATALAVSGEFNRFAASMLNIMKQVAQQLQVSVAEESVSLGLTSNMQPAKGLGLASNQSRLQKQKPTQRQAQEQHGQGLEQQQMNQDNNQDQDQDQNYEQGQGIQELNQRQEQAQQEPGQKQQDEVGQDIPLVQKRFKKLWTDSRIKEIQNLENSLATPQMEVTIDKYDMLHQKHSLREHWNEWFYGHNDYPSIWRLNKFKGRSWRASNSARRYKFKKDVIYSILDRMLTMEGELRDRERELL